MRGIIHAAGVLDDGLIQQQTWQRFTKVMAPKVQGAWNLHNLSQHESLDFFVMFSSSASLLGAPGQGNYAAANAFLDALASYRRSQGLAGLSINWGPWAEVGMTAKLQLGVRNTRNAADGITCAGGSYADELDAILGKTNGNYSNIFPIAAELRIKSWPAICYRVS